MSDLLFSIIIPVYNVEKYISECLDSILNQDFDNFEIIAVDDGTKDNSGKIIDEYAKRDSRVKVIHKENGGLVSARKAGAEKACGTYILNVDSDDYLEMGALKLIAKACLDTNADIVCYGAYRTSPHEKRQMNIFLKEGLYNTYEELNSLHSKIIYDDTKPYFSQGIYPSLWSKAIKRDIYKTCQQKAENSVSMGEDMMVSLPAMLMAKSIYVINKPLYNYRVNQMSITLKYKPNEFEELITLIDNIKTNVDMNYENMHQQLDAYIYHRFYNICMAEFTFVKSYMANSKKLSRYINVLKNYLSVKKCLYENKKYKMARFVIKNKLWIFFFINAMRVKMKKEKLMQSK